MDRGSFRGEQSSYKQCNGSRECGERRHQHNCLKSDPPISNSGVDDQGSTAPPPCEASQSYELCVIAFFLAGRGYEPVGEN